MTLINNGYYELNMNKSTITIFTLDLAGIGHLTLLYQFYLTKTHLVIINLKLSDSP